MVFVSKNTPDQETGRVELKEELSTTNLENIYKRKKAKDILV
jgi:hypothetical protein